MGTSGDLACYLAAPNTKCSVTTYLIVAQRKAVRQQGFAYVDFATPEALAAAVARSGQVELRKFRLAVAVSAPTGGGGRGRGDRGRGRGGTPGPHGGGRQPLGAEVHGGRGYGSGRGYGGRDGRGRGFRGGFRGGRGSDGLEPMDARKGADHHRQHLDVGGGGSGGGGVGARGGRPAGQATFLPRALAAKPAGGGGGGERGGGAASEAPKSNAEFRKMLLKK